MKPRLLPCLTILALAAVAHAQEPVEPGGAGGSPAAPAPGAPAQGPVVFAEEPVGEPRLGIDFRIGGVAFDGDCWDDDVAAFGDVGLELWAPGGFVGLWAGVGVQGASYVWEDAWGEVESDVVAIPWGASLLARVPLSDTLALRAEAGARYVDMDIDDRDDDDWHRRRRHRDDEWDRYRFPDRYLGVDDTSLAVVSLRLEFALDPVRLAAGGGYQFDLEKPDVEYDGRRIGEVDLSGALFFVDVGVVF